MLDLTDEINSMITERHMDEDKVLSLIRDMLVSAYKRKFGTEHRRDAHFAHAVAGRRGKGGHRERRGVFRSHAGAFDGAQRLRSDASLSGRYAGGRSSQRRRRRDRARACF